MQDLGWLEAWGLWWTGADLRDSSLWGLSMVFWARFGKVLQFLGGAVAVLDLLGPEWMVRQADKIQEARRDGGHVIDAFLVRSTEQASRRIDFVYVLIIIGSPLVTLYLSVLVYGGLGIDVASLNWFSKAIFCLCGLIPAPFLALALDRIFLAVFMLLGKILTLGRNANRTRRVAFVLVVIGFQLDLLGS